MKLKYHYITAALITLLASCANTPPVKVTYQDEQGNTYSYSEKGGLEIAIESNK